MENARDLVSEVGYVPLAAAAYTEGLEKVRSGQATPFKMAPQAVMMKLTGTIEIDGSSTVFPVSEAIAEEFNKIHGDVRVNVGVSGTGGGFKRFTVGETDISDASRPIKDKESGGRDCQWRSELSTWSSW